MSEPAPAPTKIDVTLGPLCDYITQDFNSSPEEIWGEYGVGPDRYIQAYPALDPVVQMEAGKQGLWIVPIVCNYSVDSSHKRGTGGRGQTASIKSLSRMPSVSLCLSVPFQTNDTAGIDVGSWPEVKKLLELRERIDAYAARASWGFNIMSIEADPAQEVSLKQRWFLTVTEIIFDGQTCV